jgi:isoleucyl-tRNA synthetase
VGFTPHEKEMKGENRNQLDRWILSKLHYLIKICRESIESYDLKTACRHLDLFVDDLSNWYIRHNRRRYWKTEITGDTLAAYHTLFESVYTLIRLLAPMLPMLTEEIYRNMVYGAVEGAPESIHLTAYPVPDESLIDTGLNEEMESVKNIIALAISLRNREKLKIRQPLGTLTIALADKDELEVMGNYSDLIAGDLNVKNVFLTGTGAGRPVEKRIKPNYKTLGPRFGERTGRVAEAIVLHFENNEIDAEDGRELSVDGFSLRIEKEDLLVEHIDPPHLSIIDYRGGWIALDTTITEELEREGFAREFVRHLQVLRKKTGLEPEHRIEVVLETLSSKMEEVIAEYAGFICDELLCNGISEKKISDGHEISINNEKIIVRIFKVE